MHHHLTFSNDERPSTDSSQLHERAKQSSPVQQHMDDSIQDATNEEEEDCPTALLYDDIWLEEPVPDRHLCIHELSQLHDQCPYPCLYSLDQLHSTPEDTPTPHYETMDLSDLSDF